jgi:hypothetical protein
LRPPDGSPSAAALCRGRRDAETARRIAVVSHVQSAVVAFMVFFAVAMARGLGAMPGC